jgi:hypothetical protein
VQFFLQSALLFQVPHLLAPQVKFEKHLYMDGRAGPGAGDGEAVQFLLHALLFA